MRRCEPKLMFCTEDARRNVAMLQRDADVLVEVEDTQDMFNVCSYSNVKCIL